MEQQILSEKERLCIICQKCCRELYIYTHPVLYGCPAEVVVEFYQARGFRVIKLEEDALILALDHTCPHLTQAGCDIYDKRPQACMAYSGLEDFGEACLWSTLKKEGA